MRAILLSNRKFHLKFKSASGRYYVFHIVTEYARKIFGASRVILKTNVSVTTISFLISAPRGCTYSHFEYRFLLMTVFQCILLNLFEDVFISIAGREGEYKNFGALCVTFLWLLYGAHTGFFLGKCLEDIIVS